ENDVVAILELDQAKFIVTNLAIKLGLDLRLFEDLRSRATDMESTHRQLRPGLSDRLSGDNAYGLAQFHQTARGEIATVTINANAMLAFARQYRPNFYFLNAGALDRFGFDLVNLLVGFDQLSLGIGRIDDIVAIEAAHETLAQFHDFIFALINR